MTFRDLMSPERQQKYDEYHAAYRKSHPDKRSTNSRKSNKRLKLTNTYARMLCRVTGRGELKTRHIYLGLPLLPREEFLSWAEKDETFHKLFDVWRDAGYPAALSPSIDRINPSKGYELGNIQWLSLGDNSRKGAEDSMQVRLDALTPDERNAYLRGYKTGYSAGVRSRA